MHTFYDNDAITLIKQERVTEEQLKFETKGKEIKNPYASFLLFSGVFLLFLALPGYFDLRSGETFAGTIWLSVYGLIFLLLTAGLIQTLIQRNVAVMMNTGFNELQQNPSTELNPPQQLTVPPFQLDVYEQNELPDHTYTLNTNLSEEKNIFNLAPLRIFYFFNFYSTLSLTNKLSGGFQRHGPVFFLGSPRDISFSKFRDMFSIKKIMRQLLLTTPEKLAEAMDNISGKPFPPKTKGLMNENYFDGAYPSNVFYCTDAIWKQCVAILFNKTDCAIIDACDYTPERAGLQWEIGQIINHIANENFVVFINSNTDIVALGTSFRNAWKQMQSSSPNNKLNPGAVRFIFSQSPDRTVAKKEHKNIFYEIGHQQAVSNDKIIALLLQSKEGSISA
jgi:hypothetical protein